MSELEIQTFFLLWWGSSIGSSCGKRNTNPSWFRHNTVLNQCTPFANTRNQTYLEGKIFGATQRMMKKTEIILINCFFNFNQRKLKMCPQFWIRPFIIAYWFKWRILCICLSGWCVSTYLVVWDQLFLTSLPRGWPVVERVDSQPRSLLEKKWFKPAWTSLTFMTFPCICLKIYCGHSTCSQLSLSLRKK